MRRAPRFVVVVLLLTLLTTAIAVAAKSRVLASGRFEGRSDHVVSGGVSILETEAGHVLILEPDFRLDGAPDPKLALGKDGYDSETLFSLLESNEGAQVYALPQSIDAERYNEVWVWCEKFDVPLGVARLEK